MEKRVVAGFVLVRVVEEAECRVPVQLLVETQRWKLGLKTTLFGIIEVVASELHQILIVLEPLRQCERHYRLVGQLGGSGAFHFHHLFEADRKVRPCVGSGSRWFGCNSFVWSDATLYQKLRRDRAQALPASPALESHYFE